MDETGAQSRDRRVLREDQAHGAPRYSIRTFLPYSLALTCFLAYALFSLESLALSLYESTSDPTDIRLRPRAVILPKTTQRQPSTRAQKPMPMPEPADRQEKVSPGGTGESSADQRLIEGMRAERLQPRVGKELNGFGEGEHASTDGTMGDTRKSVFEWQIGGNIDLGEEDELYSTKPTDEQSGRPRAGDSIGEDIPRRPGTGDERGPYDRGKDKGVHGYTDVGVSGTCRGYEEVSEVVIGNKWRLGQIHWFHKENGRKMESPMTAFAYFSIARDGRVRDCRVRTEPTSYAGFEEKLADKISGLSFGPADCVTDVRWTIRF